MRGAKETCNGKPYLKKWHVERLLYYKQPAGGRKGTLYDEYEYESTSANPC